MLKKENVVNDLLNYGDFKIVQNKDMFCFSLDSILLANFVNLKKTTKKILDIGTGNAPIPLVLSTKTSAKITGVEIQQEVYKLAIETVKINNKEKQIDLINDDINNFYLNVESDTYDIITCNPPFFKVFNDSNLNESDYKKYARHEISLGIEQIFKISRKILKNNGSINIVHRPERLFEIMCLMKDNNIEPKRIKIIYPKKDKQSNMILIEGVKNGKPGLSIDFPLFIHEENGEYTKEVKKLFE